MGNADVQNVAPRQRDGGQVSGLAAHPTRCAATPGHSRPGHAGEHHAVHDARANYRAHETVCRSCPPGNHCREWKSAAKAALSQPNRYRGSAQAVQRAAEHQSNGRTGVLALALAVVLRHRPIIANAAHTAQVLTPDSHAHGGDRTGKLAALRFGHFQYRLLIQLR
jgi:hypothetical protein